MSTTFDEYCEAFFESVISCDDRPKMIVDGSVRIAILEHYKFAQLKMKIEDADDQSYRYDEIEDADIEAVIDQRTFFRKMLPTTAALIEALTPFRAFRFTLPKLQYRSRYDEIICEMFEDFIFPHYSLPVSYDTARRVFEEMVWKPDVSSALSVIIAGIQPTDYDFQIVVSGLICRLCGLDNLDEFYEFLKRFPEFRLFC